MIELLHTDCLEYMKGVTDKFFDLAICDPPYGINGTVEIGLGDKKSGRVNRESKWGNKNWDTRPNEKYFNELFRISKNQIVSGGNYFIDYLNPNRCWIIWDKVQRINQADAELFWTSFDSSVRIFTYSCSKLQGFMNPDRFHPTEKPVALYKWLLKNYAKEGDKIFDSHGGSMSIAIACHDMKFDLTLCEIDEDYYKAGVKRFEDHKKQLQLW